MVKLSQLLRPKQPNPHELTVSQLTDKGICIPFYFVPQPKGIPVSYLSQLTMTNN